MTTIGPKQAPLTQSQRTQALEGVRDGLAKLTSTQIDKAADEAGTAAAAAAVALDQATAALGHTLDAGVSSAAALKSGAEGVLLATAGAVVRVAEEVGDLLGRALQMVGRALIAVGNLLRRMAGGAQIVISDLQKGDGGKSLSERLQGKSADAFAAAAASLEQGLKSLVEAKGDATGASKSLLVAAQSLAQSAAHLGAAGAIGAAAVAVDAAKVAVDATERGVDGAGALLQGAGKAVIAAGNALNTAAGTDTAVKPST